MEYHSHMEHYNSGKGLGVLGMRDFTGFNHCPSCGSENLTDIQRKGIRCRHCGFTYFHNTAAAVGAIIETPHGVILLERATEPQKGFFDVPGGFVDYDEQLEEALHRELFEELHIEHVTLSYLCSFPNTYVYKGVTYFTTDVFFHCTFEQIQSIVCNEEVAQIQIIAPEAIPFEDLAFSSGKAALQFYLLHGR